MQDYVQAWKFIVEHVRKVVDPVLQNALLAEYRKRALREWGFDPVTSKIATPEAKLDAWEEEFVHDTEDCVMYGVDTRAEKRKQTEREAFSSMVAYVRQGGSLMAIPDEIRSPEIIDLYFRASHHETEELLRAADDLLKNS